jgi:hypothetical protein
MQNVGRDGNEDISEWERLPERVENRLLARLPTSRMKGMGVSISEEISVPGSFVITQRVSSV